MLGNLAQHLFLTVWPAHRTTIDTRIATL